MMQELNERMAAAEAQIKNQNDRLNRHGEQIDSLRINDARIEAKLDSVCKEVQSVKQDVADVKKDVGVNTEMTQSIKLTTRQILWLAGAATTFFTLWQTIKQMGWL
jgi:chromosome segregation ATPase